MRFTLQRSSSHEVKHAQESGDLKAEAASAETDNGGERTARPCALAAVIPIKGRPLVACASSNPPSPHPPSGLFCLVSQPPVISGLGHQSDWLTYTVRQLASYLQFRQRLQSLEIRAIRRNGQQN